MKCKKFRDVISFHGCDLYLIRKWLYLTMFSIILGGIKIMLWQIKFNTHIKIL